MEEMNSPLKVLAVEVRIRRFGFWFFLISVAGFESREKEVAIRV